MSISAADALLRVGTRVSVAAVLTLAVGLLGVLMVVTLVDTPPVLFKFTGRDEGGVSGALNPDTKVALLKDELGMPFVVLDVLELLLAAVLLLAVDGFCSGMLSVSLSPPYFVFFF